jgi:hypothetical protein
MAKNLGTRSLLVQEGVSGRLLDIEVGCEDGVKVRASSRSQLKSRG